MRAPRSYIVRIYRRGFRTLSGVVEDTRTNAQHPFKNTDELISLLKVPNSGAKPLGRQGKNRSTA
jgi:hypothetical protein